MTRLFLRLLGIKDFEVCLSCQTLKEQLQYEREEKKQLTETLLNILKPTIQEATPVTVNELQASSALFSRRRAALETRYREEARLKKDSSLMGKPDDTIASLEKELEIPAEG